MEALDENERLASSSNTTTPTISWGRQNAEKSSEELRRGGSGFQPVVRLLPNGHPIP